MLGSGSGGQDLPYERYPRPPAEEDRLLSRIALSNQLRTEIPGAIPPLVTDAVLSPLVIGEYLVQSLFDSSKGLLIPVAISTLIGLLMVWRMRAR